jgi:hypothetical protein
VFEKGGNCDPHPHSPIITNLTAKAQDHLLSLSSRALVLHTVAKTQRKSPTQRKGIEPPPRSSAESFITCHDPPHTKKKKKKKKEEEERNLMLLKVACLSVEVGGETEGRAELKS